jgi:predicted aconitase
LRLNDLERQMLDGAHGEAVREALSQQMEVGRFFGADRFVEVSNVHMMGDVEVMGDHGLEFLRGASRSGAVAVRPLTTNARCVDFAWARAFGQDEGMLGKEREIIALLQALGATTVDTCINYQTVYQPHLGEHVAWGDTGTVIYANSVLGARSNFESGPAALAAALTGRTPAYGFHLDEKRRGTFVVELDVELKDLADWGALGKIVGEADLDYFAVPVFTGVKSSPSADSLKHLGASLASYGSMAMFHMVGVTPEARTLDDALGGRLPSRVMRITADDLQRVYDSYATGDGLASVVVFSGPQLSLFELEALAALFDGRQRHPDTAVFATTSPAILAEARRLGIAQKLESCGVGLLQGVCFYLLERLSEIRRERGWVNFVSNSAKIVNTITAHRFKTILRRTDECVEIALRGRL